MEVWCENNSIGDDPRLDDLFCAHLKAVFCSAREQLGLASDFQEAVCRTLKLLLGEDDFQWVLDACMKALDDLRVLSERADEAEPVSTGGSSRLERALGVCRPFSFLVAGDKRPISDALSKRRALYAVTNVQLKLLFRLSKLELCDSLVHMVEETGEAETAFPQADLVTFKFYIGRISILKDDFHKARRYLLEAFYQCHPRQHALHRREVLRYLIPVQMLAGVFPSPQLIEKVCVCLSLSFSLILTLAPNSTTCQNWARWPPACLPGT